MGEVGTTVLWEVVFINQSLLENCKPFFPCTTNAAGELEYEIPAPLLCLALTAVQGSESPVTPNKQY
jgi:hypothetical protein